MKTNSPARSFLELETQREVPKKSRLPGGTSSSLIFDIPDDVQFESDKDAPARVVATSIFGEVIHDVDVSAGVHLSSDYWEVPSKIVLGFDFYKLFFLNMENRDFDVSVLQVIMSFQKLTKLVGLHLAKESIRDIVEMHPPDSDVISWKSFLQYIMSFEKRSKFGAQRGRTFTQEIAAPLSLKKPTELLLTLRERIYLTMEEPSSSLTAQSISILRVLVIFLSTLGLVMESLPVYRYPPVNNPLGEPLPDASFAIIEAVTIGFFAVDFFIRICIVGAVRAEILDKQELVRLGTLRSPVRVAKTPLARIARFLMLPMSMVDIFSITPYFVSLVVNATGGDVQSGGFQIARMIRLIGVLRLLRMKQFKDIQQILRKAFSNSMGALSILFFVFAIVILFFAVIVYLPEAGTWYPTGSLVNGVPVIVGAYYRPQAINESLLELTPFTSIPASMWFAIISATTVGYGDMVPTSGWGKLVGSFLALSGIVVLAMPIAVVGSNFATEYVKFYAIRAQLILSKEADMHATLMAKFNQQHDHRNTSPKAEVVETVVAAKSGASTDFLTILEGWVDEDEVLKPVMTKMRRLYDTTNPVDAVQVAEAVRTSLEIVANSGRSGIRKAAVEKIIFEIAAEKTKNTN